MPRFADPSLCPDCRTRLPADPIVCPQCALPLRGPVASSLLATLTTADQLLTELRASAVATTPLDLLADVIPSASWPENADAPAPARARSRGLSAASVPKILLGLGALCLLVAAVTFLAVAWSWLGVGGRTTVLVALTLLAGALGSWLARRGLQIAGESLTSVAFGLLALDVVGADNAGWFGDLSSSGLAIAVGGALGVAALALVLTGPARLAVPQVVAPLGLWIATLGAIGSCDHDHVVAVLTVLTATGLAALGLARELRVLAVSAMVAGAAWWAWLALSGLADAADHATLRDLWLGGHGGGLLAASALALAPLGLRPARWVPQLSLAAAAVLASVAVALPGLDDSTTRLAVVCLGFLLVWSAVAVVIPRRWVSVPAAPMTLAGLPVLTLAAGLAAEATGNVFGVGEPFTRSAGVRLEHVPTEAHPALLVPLVVGVLVALWAVAPGSVRRAVALSAAPMVALAGIATLALFAVPLWTVVAAPAVAGAALVAGAGRRTDERGALQAGLGGLLSLGAVAAALPSDWLATSTLAVVVAAAAALLVAGSFPGARIAGAAALPVTAAGLLWSAAEVEGLDTVYRAVPVLLVVGGLAIWQPRTELEVSAGLAAVVSAGAAIDAVSDPSTSLAIHLTLAGVLVSGSALVHPSRRPLAWLGGFLLAAATWVRFADLGVDAPEAYTLPSAVALVLVGLRRLYLDRETDTSTALAPGLVLATTPSLLWLLVTDPVSWRAVLLGLGCLALVMVGVRLRWNAPLLIGSIVGGLLVLRELAPYAAETPQWVLIGLAGTALTVVGITWESRMRDLRHAASYHGRLR